MVKGNGQLKKIVVDISYQGEGVSEKLLLCFVWVHKVIRGFNGR
jgi:hypothetical protein